MQPLVNHHTLSIIWKQYWDDLKIVVIYDGNIESKEKDYKHIKWKELQQRAGVLEKR